MSLRPTLSNSDSQYLDSAYYKGDPNLLPLSLVLHCYQGFYIKEGERKILHYFPSGFYIFAILFAICIIEIEGKWTRDVFVHLSNYMLWFYLSLAQLPNCSQAVQSHFCSWLAFSKVTLGFYLGIKNLGNVLSGCSFIDNGITVGGRGQWLKAK